MKSRIIIKDNDKSNQYAKFGKAPTMSRIVPNFVAYVISKLGFCIFYFMLSK